MKVTFWGVRGSMPTPDINKIKTGGNTTCIEVTLDNGDIIIFDAGTGLIPLGEHLVKKYKNKKLPRVSIFLTHIHWDHIYGFPFFSLNFIPNMKIQVYGPPQPDKTLEDALIDTMDYRYCPIRFSQLPSFINFIEINKGEHDFVDNAKIIIDEHNHPGGAYSYRVESGGKVFVLNTDVEHEHTKLDERIINISRDADLMVHDGQYKQSELKHYKGWGHSSPEQSIKVAKLAKVKRLGITHHNPSRLDSEIDKMEQNAQKLFENIFFCREGMEIEL